MEIALPLISGRVSLENALEDEEDVVQKLSYPEKRAVVWVHLNRRRSQIAQVVARHLGIPPSTVDVSEFTEWIHGSFNVCIPARIAKNPRWSHCPQQVMVRLPLPYKTGEEHFPGNVDEKLRCEAATYIWLQENCPSVPIPRLYGVGFPGTQSFTAIDNETWYHRLIWRIRRFRAWMFGRPIIPPYYPHTRHDLHDVGYLVIEHVSNGQMLSSSWTEHHGDPVRRANLFRGLSRILLAVAKIPQPRIGSWTVDNSGVLSLSNRPLTFQLLQVENAGLPTELPRDLTYSSAESYYSDILAAVHESRLRGQPNSIHSQADGEAQLGALMAMRALLSRFFDRRHRSGPFVMTLNDLHQSNIFVDEDWHITSLIDLEWACTRPVEMLQPPYWLASAGIGCSAPGVDEITGDELREYTTAHEEFMIAFADEESSLYRSVEYTDILRRGWETGRFWYVQALDCPAAVYAIFLFHILPRFADLGNDALDRFNRLLTSFWDRGAQDFIADKLKQHSEYQSQIRDIFASAATNQSK